jgi:hypothetical protein
MKIRILYFILCFFLLSCAKKQIKVFSSSTSSSPSENTSLFSDSNSNSTNKQIPNNIQEYFSLTDNTPSSTDYSIDNIVAAKNNIIMLENNTFFKSSELLKVPHSFLPVRSQLITDYDSDYSNIIISKNEFKLSNNPFEPTISFFYICDNAPSNVKFIVRNKSTSVSFEKSDNIFMYNAKNGFVFESYIFPNPINVKNDYSIIFSIDEKSFTYDINLYIQAPFYVYTKLDENPFIQNNLINRTDVFYIYLNKKKKVDKFLAIYGFPSDYSTYYQIYPLSCWDISSIQPGTTLKFNCNISDNFDSFNIKLVDSIVSEELIVCHGIFFSHFGTFPSQ